MRRSTLSFFLFTTCAFLFLALPTAASAQTAACSGGPPDGLVAEGEDIFVSIGLSYGNSSGSTVTYTTAVTESFTPPGGTTTTSTASSTRDLGAGLGVIITPLTGPSQFPAGVSEVLYEITSSATGSTVLGTCGYKVTAIPTGGMVDTDGDLLYDDWETTGVDLDADGTPDFTIPGADPNRADLYLEIDCIADDADNDGSYTGATDHSHCPLQSALSDVVQSFANAPNSNPDGTTGIQLHIDVGTLYGAGTTTVAGTGGVTGVYGDLGGGGDIIDETGNTVIDFDGATGNPGTSIYTLRAANFDSDRDFVFRYGIFGHQTNGRAATNDCTSGWAEGIPGNDFFVTLGGTNADGNPCWGSDANGFSVGDQAQQAGTLMHEFGHVIGHSHGGGDGVNNKPNFLSVMNYSFQMCSVPASPDGVLPGGCDYSPVDLPDLDETSLDECAGIGGNGFGAMDWDGDTNLEGVTQCQSPFNTNIAADINSDRRCISAGDNGTLDSTPANDDVIGGTNINDGPDRTCDTPAVSDDRLRRSVGNVQANPLTGWDDWDNLDFDFRGVATFTAGVSAPPDVEADPREIEEARQNLSLLTRPFVELGNSGPPTAFPGDLVTYTLEISNTGAGPALQVVADDTPPAGPAEQATFDAIPAMQTESWTVDFRVPDDWCPRTVENRLEVSWSDMAGEQDSATAQAETMILDGTPPEITLAEPLSLWPPRHDLHRFTLADCVELVVDSCDGVLDPNVQGAILSISSDEPEDAKGGGDGKTVGDIVWVDPVTFELRAERAGGGNGRVYTVNFQVSDLSGNAAPASCTVSVPHDRKQPAIDDGPSAGYTIP